jgi:hypothetical protein
VAGAAVEALETVPICGAGKEDKWANLMLSLSSPWLAAFSDFRYSIKDWKLVTGFYQILFSILVALAEVRPITFTVLILVLNLLYCWSIYREKPFNSQVNSVLEIFLSGQNAAFAIIAIVGASDALKTDKVADIVFYAFLGISAVLTAVLLIYDRVGVKHRKRMGLPQRETLSDGGARRVLDNTDQSQQRDVSCCTATCTNCKCKCGICKRCGCCPDKEDDIITVSPADWRSICDVNAVRQNIEASVQLPRSRFKMLMRTILDAVQGYVNVKIFHLAAGWFLFLAISQALTTVWYFPAAFGRNRERLELVC